MGSRGPGRWSWRRAVCWAVLGMVWLSAARRASSAELPTVEEVKKQWNEQRAPVQSLYLEIEVKGEAKIDKKEMVKYLPKVYVRDDIETIAIKGEKRYLRTYFSEDIEVLLMPPGGGMPSGFGLDPRELDPKLFPGGAEAAKRAIAELESQRRIRPAGLDSVAAYDGEEYRVYRTESNMGHRFPKTTLPTVRFESLYLAATQYFLHDPSAPDFQNQATAENMLPGLLDISQSKISKETVDGSPCLRLETTRSITLPKTDVKGLKITQTFWLDLDHGLMIRKIEGSHDPAVPISFRTVNSKPQQIVPGFWLPLECRGEEFSPTAPAPLRQQPLLVTHFKVLKWSVNDVPDSQFTFDFSAGTKVMDLVMTLDKGRDPSKSPVMYTIPADRAQLDEVIREAISGVEPRGPHVLPVVLLGVLPLSALALGLWWLRRRRMREAG